VRANNKTSALSDYKTSGNAGIFIPELTLKHRDALYERVDRSGGLSIGVILSADSATRFRDLRGPGGLDFGAFLLA
jgi:hypothetical protein